MERIEAAEVRYRAELLPDASHPNHKLWANYAHYSRARGVLVTDILSKFTPIVNQKFLDLGCGSGGTSLALAERGAKINAIDHHPGRIQKLSDLAAETGLAISATTMDAHALEFSGANFDGVILQDVIEHLPDPEVVLQEIARVLKPGGLIYLSTPNRWSPLNFISDPHWNLPAIAVLPRRAVGFCVTRIFRREDNRRSDLAALLSLRKVSRLFKNVSVQLRFVNRHVVQSLFRCPGSVVNSDLHFKAVEAVKRLRLDQALCTLVNDKFALFNHIINPTWYFVGQYRG